MSIERKVYGDGGEVTVAVLCDGQPIIMGINGKSLNPDRHSLRLTPGEARKLAALLNAAADFS